MLIKRPLIIVFFSILALAFCLVDYINPVTKVFLKWGSLGGGDVFQSIVLMIQFLLKLLVTARGMLYLTLVLIAASLFIALIFSGYFNMVNSALEGKARVKGEYFSGLKKYFVRVFFMSFVFLLLSAIFAIFLLVASVPALVITKAALSGKSGFYAAAILVDVITIIVLFFGFMFYRIYMSFWYPAAVSNTKRAFIIGKKTADMYFWGLIRRFFVVDVVFVLIHIVFMYFESSPIIFFVKWALYTLFFAFLVTYVFALYKVISNSNKSKKST